MHPDTIEGFPKEAFPQEPRKGKYFAKHQGATCLLYLYGRRYIPGTGRAREVVIMCTHGYTRDLGGKGSGELLHDSGRSGFRVSQVRGPVHTVVGRRPAAAKSSGLYRTHPHTYHFIFYFRNRPLSCIRRSPGPRFTQTQVNIGAAGLRRDVKSPNARGRSLMPASEVQLYGERW
jgi:hypothetical protein